MKKYLLFLTLMPFLIITGCANTNKNTSSNNSNYYQKTAENKAQKNSSWSGIYQGYLPGMTSLCQIQLNKNNTYDLAYFKKDKLKTKKSGELLWSYDKKIVSLFHQSKSPIEFYVAENELHLKKYGQQIFNKNEVVFKQKKIH